MPRVCGPWLGSLGGWRGIGCECTGTRAGRAEAVGPPLFLNSPTRPPSPSRFTPSSINPLLCPTGPPGASLLFLVCFSIFNALFPVLRRLILIAWLLEWDLSRQVFFQRLGLFTPLFLGFAFFDTKKTDLHRDIAYTEALGVVGAAEDSHSDQDGYYSDDECEYNDEQYGYYYEQYDYYYYCYYYQDYIEDKNRREIRKKLHKSSQPRMAFVLTGSKSTAN